MPAEEPPDPRDCIGTCLANRPSTDPGQDATRRRCAALRRLCSRAVARTPRPGGVGVHSYVELDDRVWITLNSVLGIDGGHIDAAAGSAALSSRHDRGWMDAVRAASDAVLVGAATIRGENPTLSVASSARRAERRARRRSEQPLPVVLSATGVLPDDARIFDASEPRPLLLVAANGAEHVARHAGSAEIEVLDPRESLVEGTVAVLARRGVVRLLVEGGPTIARDFMASGRVDEVCLTLSPRFGARAAPAQREAAASLGELALADVRVVDGFVYLRYLRGAAARAS